MKKRVMTAGLVCALVAALALGGCAKSGDDTLLDPGNPVTVTLWHYYVGENQQAMESAVAEFNQTEGMEKGVFVETVAMGSIGELEEAVTNSAKGVINSSEMPDLFSSYPDKALEIDGMDMLCDLNEYFTEEEKQLYVQDFLEEGIFAEGRFLVAPIVKSTELLYVNETDWDAFAQDVGATDADLETWESIYDLSQQYYNWVDEKTPALWDGKGMIGIDSVANYVIIGNKQLGTDIIDASSGGVVLDEAALRRVFEVYYTGISMRYFDAVGKFRSDDIKAGDLIEYVGSSSSAAYFPTWIEKNNTQSDIDLVALRYPVFEGGEPYAIQQGAGMCIAKTTPEKQEGAAVFLKWFTAPQQNITFAMTTGYLPVQAQAYESGAFAAALEVLGGGEEDLQNVGKVYEIALSQITELNTYAAKPFAGSYDARSLFQSTLMEKADAGRGMADTLKAQGLTADAVIKGLDVDAKFDEWMTDLRSGLDALGISYSGG